MIRLVRAGSIHDTLTALMAEIEGPELVRISALHEQRTLLSKDFGDKYQAARPDLARMQHGKCAYCEKRVEVSFNDVEHFRPKAAAVRADESTDSGYWWLAWHLPNLSFACVQCNRQCKREAFPLLLGSAILPRGHYPPGDEKPALLDPVHDDPVAHIVFRPTHGERKWLPFPRAGSFRGAKTIEILRLNRASLAELYERHVREVVRPRIQALKQHTEPRHFHEAWSSCLRSLLRASSAFAALSHDVLDFYFPAASRAKTCTELPYPPV